MEGSRVTAARARAWLAVLAAAALVALAACGEDEQQGDDRGEIRATIARTQAAFARGDVRAVCASLTDAGRRHVGGIGHDILGDGPTTPCPQDLPVFYKSVKGGGGLDDSVEIARIELDGDEATTTVEVGGSTVTVPLRREDGEWRIDALWGGVPAEQQKDHY